MTRKALGKKTRFEVFKRDGFVCQYCGAHPPSAILQVDHIVAVAAGGSNDMDNLVTSCQPCNIGKGANDLTVAPQSLAEKSAAVKEREEQLLGYQSVMEARRERLEDETWRVVEVLMPAQERVKKTLFQSVQSFIEKLGLYEVLEAAELASAKFPHISYEKSPGFRYFCGICWKKHRESQGG